jgi:hypothetical protein
VAIVYLDSNVIMKSGKAGILNLLLKTDYDFRTTTTVDLEIQTL